jgi:selenocysteine lyase/cysteine desulfurase
MALDWEEVRALFNITSEYIHLGGSQFLASHPRPVQEAIERHRQALNANPVLYAQEKENDVMQQVRQAAAKYLGLDDPNHIALTDSTTMGLGVIYTGLNLQPGQEILTTHHDHYSHLESIRWATKRTGASYRKIDLYQNLHQVSEEEIVASITRHISDNTRVVGVTWVHSSTGLKIPVARIAQALAPINASREESNRILLIVDAVHGFGIETESFPELGCDFFIAGCHKWLYGPRGTGLVAGTRQAWQTVSPIIPSFTEVMDMVTEEDERPDCMDGKQMTPGGFHSLEHRWALLEAFELVESIGRVRICDRVHQLNRQCKEGLAQMPHVTLHTPRADNLSAGIVSFEVEGFSTEEVVQHLLEQKVIATKSPYRINYPRFTPGIYNTPEEVRRGLAAVNALSSIKKK